MKINYIKRHIWILSLTMGFLGCILSTVFSSESPLQIQQGIAKEVIRFHVLANSDEPEDQELKMKVKAEVIQYLEKEMPDAIDVGEARIWLTKHLKQIRQTAQTVIRREAEEQTVNVSLAKDYFPYKSYGNCSFPAGIYEALQIKIGNAAGHNWWCVVFPNLCFIDETHGVIIDEKMKELKQVLTPEEYDCITGNAKVKIKFRLLGQ